MERGCRMKGRDVLLVVLEEDGGRSRAAGKENDLVVIDGSRFRHAAGPGGDCRGLAIVLMKDLSSRLLARMEAVARSLGEGYETLVIFEPDDIFLNGRGLDWADPRLMRFPRLAEFISTAHLLFDGGQDARRRRLEAVSGP
jgi:hypothetical protein